MKTKSFIVYIIALVAGMGGLLFGFDTSVISGAIPFLQEDFGIDNGMVETLTVAGLIGAICGAVFCGKIVDILGRRMILMISAVIFALGALWSGLSPNIYHLIMARMFLGIAIGVSSFAVPLYIAEISPKDKRGFLVSMFQLMIAIGILISYFSDLILADETRKDCWRDMLYVGIIPAVVLFVGVLFLPESPRWLLIKGRDEEGLSILSFIEKDSTVNSIYESIKKEVLYSSKDKANFFDLFKPWMRNALIICVGIMFFQQFVGINTVIYYSPKIFLMAGFDSTVSAIGASVGVGISNMLFTLVSMLLMDKLGRRKLYFIGMTGIFISLFLLTLCFSNLEYLDATGKYLSVILVFLYVAFFAVSIGPLGWLIITEIFPLKLRGLGTSVGSFAVWLCNCFVSFTFFKIMTLFSSSNLNVQGETSDNPAIAFGFYTVISLIAIVWGYYYIPETKGVSLEKIESYWRKGIKPYLIKE